MGISDWFRRRGSDDEPARTTDIAARIAALREPTRRPFVRITVEATRDVLPVTASKLGGLPYVLARLFGPSNMEHIGTFWFLRDFSQYQAAMREGATFINTGRGAQVVEADLIAVLEARPDLTALLDVTWPEPPAADSKLWALPNALISPHIGGTIGHEVTRLADCAIGEFERWQAGQPLRYQVTREVLATMG